MNDGNPVLGDEESMTIFCRVEADSFSFGNDGALANDCPADFRATPDACTWHQDRSGDLSTGTHLYGPRDNGLDDGRTRHLGVIRDDGVENHTSRVGGNACSSGSSTGVERPTGILARI